MKKVWLFVILFALSAFSVFAIETITSDSELTPYNETIVSYNFQNNENPIWTFETVRGKGCAVISPTTGPVPSCNAPLVDVTSSEGLNLAGDNKQQSVGGHSTPAQGKSLQLYYVKVPQEAGALREFEWFLDRGNVRASYNSTTYLWNFKTLKWESCDTDPAQKTSRCSKNATEIKNYVSGKRVYFMQQSGRHNDYVSADFVSFTAKGRVFQIAPSMQLCSLCNLTIQNGTLPPINSS